MPATVLLASVWWAGDTATEWAGPAKVHSASEVFASLQGRGGREGLVVVVSRDGAHVVWAAKGAATGSLYGQSEHVPCAIDGCPSPDAYDLDGLRAVLRRYKRDHPEHDTLTLAPGEDVPFRAVTDAVTAARFDGDLPLFPYAVISRQ